MIETFLMWAVVFLLAEVVRVWTMMTEPEKKAKRLLLWLGLVALGVLVLDPALDGVGDCFAMAIAVVVTTRLVHYAFKRKFGYEVPFSMY